MVAPATAPPVAVRPRRPTLPPALISLRPVWSKPAAFRAVRATVVMPGMFALTDRVLGNIQIATFAAFGSFATLVLASFGGSRLNKLLCHLGLGLVGTVLLVIGTAITSNTALAALVTVPVAFVVLFAGIVGPAFASSATAALLAYVLPAASPGTVSMIPDRIAGWWLATAAGTFAVLVLSTRPESDRLRSSAEASAIKLADVLDSALAGEDITGKMAAAMDAKIALMDVFSSAPSRPTGVSRSDQALDELVESLEWCTILVNDLAREGTDLVITAPANRELIELSAEGLREIGAMLRGTGSDFDLARFDEPQRKSTAEVAEIGPNQAFAEREVHLSFHSRMIASGVRSAVSQASAVRGALQRPELLGVGDALRSLASRAAGNTSLRSVWFLNSLRGAAALAAAVATADLVHVQHGFWVVLGTLSVLRTSAASTGSTALRAIAGTAVGFFIGAGLILAIGSDSSAFWIALPIAVFIASYAPGTAPFAVGQAAFTITISVLYNILVPVGWTVGVLRIEDVAIGAGVSAVVGILFWPRGASAIVANDLADSFRVGGLYLVQATAWAVGSRQRRPNAGTRSMAAALRLDGALRGFLSEQGTKRITRENVYRLIGTTLRIRLTAQSLADVPPPDTRPPPDMSDERARLSLVGEATLLSEWCDAVARDLTRRPTPTATAATTVDLSNDTPQAAPEGGYLLWVDEHLQHVRERLVDTGPIIDLVSSSRAVPWWR